MGRTVVITGASAGVGRATAIEFARHGWNVAMLARGSEGLEGARAQVEAAGGRALTQPCDMADAQAVFAAADRVVEQFGGIDVWVNCAMVTVFSRVHEMKPEEYRRVTEVTYLGYVHGTLAALEHMRPRNAGTIVQIGSALAFRGIPLQSAYCASKFAIRGFTESLRTELIAEGSRIRVSIVHLPSVNTPQFDWARSRLDKRPQPVPPIFQPEAAARAIFAAAQSGPREYWVGSSTVKTIIGNAVAPRLLDRMLARKAVKGQKSQTPATEQRSDNLYEPVHWDCGVHGRFDRRASGTARTVDPSTMRYALASGLIGIATAGAAASLWRSQRRHGARKHQPRIHSVAP